MLINESSRTGEFPLIKKFIVNKIHITSGIGIKTEYLEEPASVLISWRMDSFSGWARVMGSAGGVGFSNAKKHMAPQRSSI